LKSRTSGNEAYRLDARTASRAAPLDRSAVSKQKDRHAAVPPNSMLVRFIAAGDGDTKRKPLHLLQPNQECLRPLSAQEPQ